MYLFVDETECPEYFIVTGLLVNSRQDVELAYKRFKKKINNIPMLPKLKARLFTEFKSVVMDRTFQKIKVKMLQELNCFEHCIIYSCLKKKNRVLSQENKERSYVDMLARIVCSIDGNVCVMFDGFCKYDFEKNIVSEIALFEHVEEIKPVDSQTEVGIQFADNLCSVIRLHKAGMDESGFFDIIQNQVREV